MKILIYGAGALGRGFLAPLAQNAGYEFTLCDCDAQLVERLRTADCYWLAQVIDRGYFLLRIRPAATVLRGEENPAEYDYIYTAVGNSAVFSLPLAKGNVIICENNRECAQYWHQLNPSAGFGVPDVIASGTAPAAILAIDPLAVAAEPGELWVEHGPLGKITPNIGSIWYRKLYLHNIPHAALAFIGKAAGLSTIDQIAYAYMEPLRELMTLLHEAGMFAGYFEENYAYAARELERFGHVTLCDPISRVAREPARKLGRLLEGRELLHKIGVESSLLEDAIEICEAECPKEE